MRGKSVFVGTCSGYCHGMGIDVGDAPNLFDCGWIHGGSNREIYNTIANGIPNSRMVGFGGRLPDGDEDIWGEPCRRCARPSNKRLDS